MKTLLAVLVIFIVIATGAQAQPAYLNGFVSDASDGSALELVNILLIDSAGSLRGGVSNRDGFYQIGRVSPGTYLLRASYVGYHTYSDSIRLAAGERRTLNIQLSRDTAGLEEVIVRGERLEGAARVTAGQQTIRPREIELVPAPDVSGDLASYLATLPVTVSTGDRGGQLYIRGGETSQNLVMLDGMLVYQPLHLLGFYSVFPSDILSRADVYAGGFGPRFGERTSSVIDVWTRDGNKGRFSGTASISPFMSSLMLEGPILPRRVSLLVSARESMVEQLAGRYVGRPLPFSFGDAFAKLHADIGARSRLSVSALATHDRGTLRHAIADTLADEVRWQNQAASIRYLGLPAVLPIFTELRFAWSRLHSELGAPGEPSRQTTIWNGQMALDATFVGSRVDLHSGMAVRLIYTETDLGGMFQNVELKGVGIDHVAFYAEPELKLGRLSIRPGARLEFYAIHVDPVIEPRLRAVWTQGAHQVSAAAGVYHQEIVGLTNQRDAASVFTAWTNVPKRNTRQLDVLAERVPRAIHAIAGYRVTPASWIELSLEGYYKRLDNLFVAEWTSFPRQTTRLQPAEGRSFGFDTRLEVRRPPFYGFINYGLSSTRYAAKQASLALWYGEEKLRYRPAHDRRHQVNALAHVSLGGFDLSARWEFGSGLPFSRPIGFDGFVLVDDVDINPRTPRSRRAIYERPFNALLPTYHRLDLSAERSFQLRAAELTVMASVINAYDRRNIFYLDVFTLERVDQLPLVPSVGVRVGFQ